MWIYLFSLPPESCYNCDFVSVILLVSNPPTTNMHGSLLTWSHSASSSNCFHFFPISFTEKFLEKRVYVPGQLCHPLRHQAPELLASLFCWNWPLKGFLQFWKNPSWLALALGIWILSWQFILVIPPLDFENSFLAFLYHFL